MPRPKSTHGRSESYDKVRALAESMNDKSMCAVVAVHFVTGVDYKTVDQLFIKHGRNRGNGTKVEITRAVVKELGYTMKEVNHFSLVDKYPAPHNHALLSVTSHHPERFPEVWRNGKTYMMFTRGHVLAIVNGSVKDWSRGRKLRCITLLEVEKAS